MDYMNEMGSGRYRDGPAPSYADEGGWKQQQQQQQPRQQWQQQQQPGAGRDGGTTRMRQLDYMGAMGSDRYSDDDDRTNYDRLEGLDGSQQGLDSLGQQQQRVGGGKDNGATMKRQLGFMAEMGSDRYSDDDEDDVRSTVMPRGGAGGGGSRTSSGNFSSLLSEFADAMDYMDDGSYAAGSSGSARNNAAGGQGFASNPGKASYMDEDTLEWGRDMVGDVKMGGVDEEGSAAAQALRQEWQSEGQPGKGGKQYAADPSTRSREGLGASFEFDAGPGLASADSLLGQLPDAESLAGLQQQQQQPPAAAAAAAAAAGPKRKSRAGTTSRRAKKTDAADGAAASSGHKTSTRKAAAAGTKKQQGAAAAAAADAPLDGWVGGADSSDEGFEDGWVDRMMDDGNNRPGLDDVMRS
jgi:hypothetical protein